MRNEMSPFERKFGKYAIRNLTYFLVACYAVGYVLLIADRTGTLIYYLSLDPYAIIHGQVWRLFTWILIPPPTQNMFFALFMIYVYCSLGTTLERTWGTYRYNVYLFQGMLFTILGSFLLMGYFYLFYANYNLVDKAVYFRNISLNFSTYYVNMSIFLAFAATFPEAQFFLMFIIPIKAKVLGIIYGILLLFDFFNRGAIGKFVIGASLLNFVVFFITSRSKVSLNPKQIRRRQEYKRDVRRNTGITKHKCAVCGRTEENSPGMQFRFCSKCDGNYEYCEEHLYTHTHVKRG